MNIVLNEINEQFQILRLLQYKIAHKKTKKLAWMYTETGSGKTLMIVASWFELRKKPYGYRGATGATFIHENA